ncbi:MAG: RelA/SpoT family protein [Spirochaetota bacterium]
MDEKKVLNNNKDDYKLYLLLSDDFSIEERDLIIRAYAFANYSHENCKPRESKEPYFSHPYNVALIIKQFNMDAVTIASALLHDTVEDVDNVSIKTIKELFGTDVALIVDGVTKISHLKFRSKREKFVENLRKMILYMAKDIRVVIVKLADRLHNMRTLKSCEDEKQKRVAEETREIYAPLANRLGIHKFKSELEDLSMSFLEPKMYEELKEKLKIKKEERQKIVDKVSEYLRNELEKDSMQNFIVKGRPKHFYSIYRKIKRGYPFDQIYDLTAIRVITETVKDCYQALGIIHQIWNIVPDRFKDYISSPKDNGYKSLHTTVMTHLGKLVEIQIRTKEMHEIAEEGIAAHWKYKEGNAVAEKQNKEVEKNMRWIKRIRNWAKEVEDSKEGFVEGLKTDILGDQILCFTPIGEVVDLPKGSTPVDFAYNIHTEVGHTCVGAKVTRDNVNRIFPLSSELKNFDIIKIITKNNSHPSEDWLKFVRTNRAKNKIKQWIRSSQYKDNYDKGKELLLRALKNCDIPQDSPKAKHIIKSLMKGSGNTKTEDALYVDIGFTSITENELTKKIKQYIVIDEANKKQLNKRKKVNINHNKNDDKDIVKIDGMKGVPIKFARCCNPIIGDPITGFITKLAGISIHKSNCRNFLKLKEEVEKNNEHNRIVNVSWNKKNPKALMRFNITILNNEKAISEIYNIITNNGANIISINTNNINNKKKQVFVVSKPNNSNSTNMKSFLTNKLKKSPYILKVKITE